MASIQTKQKYQTASNKNNYDFLFFKEEEEVWQKQNCLKSFRSLPALAP